MNRLIILFSAIMFVTPVPDSRAQDLILNSSVTGVCYAGTKVNKMYIPPPKGFDKAVGSKGSATINVIYSGFTAEAKNAMDYAVMILRAVLPSDANITIRANWQRLSTSGVLANSRITGFADGWTINAFKPDAIYPIALAEKIAGKRLNDDSEADIEITFNSAASWYTGLDGNTPVSQYDLVTVAIHETCHGLGFFDSMDTDVSLGWYGAGSVPVIYDLFVENLNERKLTDTLFFDNYSPALRSELTGGQLYFNGPLLKNYSGTRARLFAPSTWDPGSSVSHLDETRTPAVHSLMTPFIDKGEAIHDPGQWTLSILGDLGWINTRIVHKQLADTEEPVANVTLAATVISDTLYNRNKVGAVYSFDGFQTETVTFLTSFSGNDDFSAIINIPGYNISMEYYFFAEDHFLREYKMPSPGKRAPFRTFIGIDTIKPVIRHVAPGYVLDMIDTIKFEAAITDNIGIDTAFIEYRINDGITRYYGLSASDSVNFSAAIDFKDELLEGDDKIFYRITAIDKAMIPNTRVVPSAGYYEIAVEGTKAVVEGYSTDFEDIDNDFFMIGFKIEKPPLFSDFALHTRHPYESPEVNDSSLEYIAILRHPVIYRADGMIVSYREIVLVEPGEDGSIYGSMDFYDYVIIEGSKDFGKSWFRLTDGYDSRYNSAWLEAYNSRISGMNSNYTGRETDYFSRVINPQFPGNISEGDTIVIRFRLFSDPYAWGWGWAIDDFRINPLINNVDRTEITPFIIYPNPGTGMINVKSGSAENGKPILYSVYNSSGTCIRRDRTINDSEMRINISGYPSGIYIIVLQMDNKTTAVKYILIR
ncbi:MAG: T9SS type A sorting domain-containing protein [Bacteroidales bacterium]